MAKKYNPLEPQVSKRTYIIIISVLVVLLALIFILAPSNKTKIYNEYKAFATDDFTNEHPYYEITYKNGLFKKGLKSVLAKEEVVLIFVSNSRCQKCVTHIGAFEKYYNQLNVDEQINKIYYYNSTKSAKDFKNFQDNVYGVSTESPQMLLYVNGEIKKRFIFDDNTSSQSINRSVKDFYLDVLDIIK
jgi:hypothetical protein